MEEGEAPVPTGRARGRARGNVREGDVGPDLRVSPPGRPLEPRMSQLSLQDSPGSVDPEYLTRYGGNGNGNGNGHSSNGNGGNGNGNGHSSSGNGNGRNGNARDGEPRQPPENLDRYDYIVSRPNANFPKEGKQGQPSLHLANYFAVKTGTEWAIFQYRVDFAPAIDETKLRRFIMKSFRKPIAEGGFGLYVFDGHSLWTVNRFMQNFDDPPIIKTATLTEDATQYTITMKMVAMLGVTDPRYLQFMNNITRTCLRALELCQMGRNYFDPKAEIALPNYRIRLWPGFVTTLRQHDAGLLYCVELTHKVIRMDNCFTIMTKIRNECQARGGDFRALIAKEIVGTVVLTMYNNRTYRIDDVSWDENPESTFKLKDGTEVSFRDYYRRYEKHPILNLRQPLLVSNPKPRDIRMGRDQPVKLIPELCQMTGLNEQMRSNFTMMKDLGQYLFQPPQAKMENTIAFMRRLSQAPKAREELSGWGMELATNPIQVPARVLPKESIFISDKNPNIVAPVMQVPDDKADFSKAFRGAGVMIKCINLVNWVIIVQSRDAQGVDGLVQMMQRVSTPLGFRISAVSEIVRLQNQSPESYNSAVQAAIGKNPKLQMVFVILPNNRLEAYAAVKKKCYLDYAMPSQCFLPKNVTHKGLMSIATKVVIQMNVKLGGECWGVPIPLKSLMIVGFDVHHGGAAGTRAKSVGAMVATVTPNYCTYFSTVSFSSGGVELSQNMAADIEKCLVAFRKSNNGNLPDRVIFYRDGVGEGQLAFVYNTELEAIKARLKDIYSGAGRDEPKFTMIICTKRINTRIFNKLGPGRVDNPVPGTVVDSRITLPERWDFFLIAQCARQGMVSPTNYNVLYDGNQLDADKVQRLTYKLCHMYYNWNGTVAVPAVVQYAHKLAFLTGTALGRPGNPGLSHTLYFL